MNINQLTISVNSKLSIKNSKLFAMIVLNSISLTGVIKKIRRREINTLNA
jgi:hypothetical protein